MDTSVGAESSTLLNPSTFNESGNFATLKNSSTHPIVVAFHLLFRSLALLTYLFGTAFFNNFVLVFVIVLLLLSFDFWTVKNISGRLLVGLRWWNETAEDGSSQWKFESRENSSEVASTFDRRVFWYSLFLSVALWAMFGITSLLKLNVQWLLLVMIALALNVANLVGYVKCHKDAEQRISNSVTNVLVSASIWKRLRGMFGA